MIQYQQTTGGAIAHTARQRSYILASLLPLVIGMGLHTAAVVTVKWSVALQGTILEMDLGLFQFCQAGICRTYDSASQQLLIEQLTNIKITEAFALLGCIFCGLGLLLAPIYFFLPQRGVMPSRRIGKTIGNIAALGGSFSFTSALIWVCAINNSSMDSLGYSFYMSISGGFIFYAGAILLFLSGRAASQ